MSKKVIFHSNQLGLRGTEVALYDYAHYNETILGNESWITYPSNSDMQAYEKFHSRFGDRMLPYSDFSSLSSLLPTLGITHAYFIKAGYNDGRLIQGVKNMVHAVFDASHPHGDVYVAVSSWLGNKHGVDYLPHIVTLPEVSGNYREFLKIPKDALVVGRYGGYDQFDVPYLGQVIQKASSLGVYFLLMNTKIITPPNERVIYLSSTYDLEEKRAFLDTCDLFLHGRTEGESFGLSICEALYSGIPVASNIECRDMNHIKVMGDKGLYYDSLNELLAIILNFKKTSFNYRSLVEEFSAEKVMSKFNKMFLK